MAAASHSDEPPSKARHSRALEPALITDPIARAEAEAMNGLRQYDYAVQAIQQAIEREAFKLRLSLILSLHREALDGISAYAGNFRPGDVKIEGSRHAPPGAHLVAEEVEGLCDYVNDRWDTASAIHLAAHRHLYEEALDAADDAWKSGKVDVTKMENLIQSLLATQLAHVYEMAGGKLATSPTKNSPKS